jgi:hypothetical protein
MYWGDAEQAEADKMLATPADISEQAMLAAANREGGRWLRKKVGTTQLLDDAARLTPWLQRAVVIDRYCNLVVLKRFMCDLGRRGVRHFKVFTEDVAREGSEEDAEKESTQKKGNHSDKVGACKNEEELTKKLGLPHGLPEGVASLKVSIVNPRNFDSICHGRFLLLYADSRSPPGKAYYLDQGLRLWDSGSADEQVAFDVVSESAHRLVSRLARHPVRVLFPVGRARLPSMPSDDL